MFSRGYVSQEDVDRVFNEGHIEDFQNGNTTVVIWKWRDRWAIVKDSSCVRVENYSHEIGISICYKKIKDELWKLLGFMLFLYDEDIMN